MLFFVFKDFNDNSLLLPFLLLISIGIMIFFRFIQSKVYSTPIKFSLLDYTLIGGKLLLIVVFFIYPSWYLDFIAEILIPAGIFINAVFIGQVPFTLLKPDYAIEPDKESWVKPVNPRVVCPMDDGKEYEPPRRG